MATYRDLQLSTLFPHPVIVRSVNASLAFEDPQHLARFSDEMLQVLQRSQPAHVVQEKPKPKDGVEEKSKPARYLFFAGWRLFHELRRRGLTKICAVVHEESPPNMEAWAVMAELGELSAAGSDDRYRTEAYRLLSTQKVLWPRIFSGDRPRTPATALERLCGISRAAAQRIANPAGTQSEPSLLEQILNETREQQ